MGKETYPKYFKTAGQMQSGKLGPMVVSNGLIEVLNEEHEAILVNLPTFQDGGIIQVGKGQSVEVLPNGGFKKITVPNRFANVFTDEELENINRIPDDEFEEVLMFNIRALAKKYSENGDEESNSELGIMNDELENEGAEKDNTGADEPPAGPVVEPFEMKAFKSKDAIKQRLEELGVAYPNGAKMVELYEIYTKHFESV